MVDTICSKIVHEGNLSDMSLSAAALVPRPAASLLTVALAVAANMGRCPRLWNLPVEGGPLVPVSSSLDPTAESSPSPRCGACRGSLDHRPAYASNSYYLAFNTEFWIVGRKAHHAATVGLKRCTELSVRSQSS